jgi:hypothetical protein
MIRTPADRCDSSRPEHDSSQVAREPARTAPCKPQTRQMRQANCVGRRASRQASRPCRQASRRNAGRPEMISFLTCRHGRLACRVFEACLPVACLPTSSACSLVCIVGSPADELGFIFGLTGVDAGKYPRKMERTCVQCAPSLAAVRSARYFSWSRRVCRPFAYEPCSCLYWTCAVISAVGR